MSAALARLTGAFCFKGGPFECARTQWDDSAETFCAHGLTMIRTTYAASSPEVRSQTGLASTCGDACIWDGRLDNRAELAAELGTACPAHASDAVTALAVWRRDGDAGLARLVGDWSLVLWDEASRAVVLASDYAGARPLYYRLDAHRLLWSSTLDGLAAGTAEADLDEQYFAEFLTCGVVAHRTPYRNIHSVPPGAAVRVSARHNHIRRFWDLPASRVTRYARESDYEDRLRDLFREAVACRVDTVGTVSTELSGGLDSSSVTCMAQQLIEQQSVAASELVTITYQQDGSPDKPFYMTVERACASRCVHLEAAALPPVSADFPGEAAPLLWNARFHALARQLAARNAGVLLTGQLGDLVMANWIDDSEQLADRLLAGQWSLAVREAFAWSRWLRRPVWPILGRAAAAALGKGDVGDHFDPSPGDSAKNPFGDSVMPALRARVRSSAAQLPNSWRDASPGRRKHFRALDELLQARKIECPPPLLHLSCTHPFLHRPLVEFMLTIPHEIACRPGEPRRLMRRTFSGLLPAAVLSRRSKASYRGLFASSLRPLAGQILDDVSAMQLVRRGYVNAESVSARLRRLAGGLECNEVQLRSLILLELWFRARGARSLPAAAPAA
jgi:asparagine synthase (glutamine-hydrolysing)